MEKQIKILVECFWYKESGPYFTYGFIKGLLANDVDVYVITSDIMENLTEWRTIIPNEKMFLWRGLPRHNKPLSYICHLWQIQKKFKGIWFDCIISTFPGRSDTIINHFIKRKEAIMILHDVIPHSSTKKSTTNYIYKYIQKSDCILVLTKNYISEIKKIFGYDDKHILYMRHGLMAYPHSNIRQHDDGIINFLYFGRIDGYKGLGILAEAYRSLSVKYDNISLRIAGKGDFQKYEAKYKGLKGVTIDNRYIEDSEIANFFEKPNTILVLPYTDATQSGVIGIAYDFEVPIIASDLVGLREQLFDGEVGCLCEPNDPSALASKMEKLILDKKERDRQTILMKEYKDKMTWECVTSELLRQIKERA